MSKFKLPKVVLQRFPRVEDEPRFFIQRESGDRWNENSTSIRFGGNWMLILERQPTADDLAADQAEREAETARHMTARGFKPHLV